MNADERQPERPSTGKRLGGAMTSPEAPKTHPAKGLANKTRAFLALCHVKYDEPR
jgi:hypothetical protein